ncbi:hypothetical protein GCM10010992_10600 [Cloacibacterium rupense]|uniref:DUF5689 domain-containing protein n=1 Tax=Cloacibacterium rupense TaxID=517423 RepID=A0ABQ2NK14_9FLAO|nr:DUF5689 domain-containing protein [Cloacibacterium rupense]GGP03190.1 hypothetical protein GCM10010992_10600 [Cloacibacterium rupense]
MKKYFSIIRFFILASAFVLTGCVHDDKYNAPDLSGNCQDLKATITLAAAKNLAQNTTITTDDVIEGYVSSTDQSGNIYKAIYIQDDPANPTQGFVLSVDAISTYSSYPQGSKIYIKLKGLAMGTYGGVKQLGYMDNGTFGRIPEKMVPTSILKSCAAKVEITPKVMTLADMKTANDQYIGCLVKVQNAEFDAKVLCSNYAPDGYTVDRQINDPTTTATTRVVRNSGFASFANQKLPSGKGDFIGILSKFNSTYQLFINNVSDLKGMTNFPRKDGIAGDPCTLDATATAKTVAEVKQLYTTGNFNQITGNFFVKAKVTANDETGNLFKYIYVEDATGGIRVNINKTNLYQDPRFKVGKNLIIKLKDLYIGVNGGEFQIGQPFNGNIGQIAEVDVYKAFYDSNEPITSVVATEKTIANLTTADVGRWIKIKGLQFIDADLGKTFAAGSTTNRTLEDCSGNKIILRTSSFASFAGSTLDNGKGDVYAILSIFNGNYQLWIPKQVNADLDGVRCDGTLPVYETIFSDSFASLSNWTAVNVSGTQIWSTTTFGNPAPSAIMDGARSANEDWLISKKINVPSTYKEVFFSFETDGRYSGNPLEVYITDNYTGAVSSTNWTKTNPALDTDLASFAGFVNSGKVDISSYKGKDIVVAFKYTSVSGSSTTWEVDNFAVKGSK